MRTLPRLLAFVLGVGPLALVASELPCASAESIDGLMRTWGDGFSAQHPDTPACVVRRARYSADFVVPLARGEVRVAPFVRELFAADALGYLPLNADEAAAERAKL